MTDFDRVTEQIRRLAAEKNAVILAHNYERPEIQDVADYVGDSLGLSRQAASTDAATIVFCGVHFMAETASIISPDKTVPDPGSQRRLLAGGQHHRVTAAVVEGRSPGCVCCQLREHECRGQGRVRLLRDVLERGHGGGIIADGR